MKITFSIDPPPAAVDPATGRPYEWGLNVELVAVPAGAPAVSVGTTLTLDPAPKAPAKS